MRYVIGADEVGRGCLAGSVYVCGGAVPVDMAKLEGVRDSKKLSAKQREALSPKVKALPGTYWKIASRDAAYIDKHGIVNAVRSCFQEVIEGLLAVLTNQGHSVALIKIDGEPLWEQNKYVAPTYFIVKGDDLEWCIGAASIVAKVERDAYIAKLGEQFPQYKWSKNAAYGTKEHTDAIKQYGLTTHHRVTFCKAFAPVKGKVFEDELDILNLFD